MSQISREDLYAAFAPKGEGDPSSPTSSPTRQGVSRQQLYDLYAKEPPKPERTGDGLVEGTFKAALDSTYRTIGQSYGGAAILAERGPALAARVLQQVAAPATTGVKDDQGRLALERAIDNFNPLRRMGLPDRLRGAQVFIDQIRQRQIGYEPSNQPGQVFAEQVAGSLPTAAVGVGVSVAGSPLAGAAFMASADALGVMNDTYETGIKNGLAPDTAADRAIVATSVYVPVSLALERLGVDAALARSPVVKRVLGRAASKFGEGIAGRVVAAGVRTAGAAGTEGLTEGAQTILGETLRTVATEDWQGFRDLWTNSDEALRAAMIGATLGGGIRAVGEAADPANFRSFAEWRAAAGKGEQAPAEAQPAAQAGEGGPQNPPVVGQPGGPRIFTEALPDDPFADSGTPTGGQQNTSPIRAGDVLRGTQPPLSGMVTGDGAGPVQPVSAGSGDSSPTGPAGGGAREGVRGPGAALGEGGGRAQGGGGEGGPGAIRTPGGVDSGAATDPEVEAAAVRLLEANGARVPPAVGGGSAAPRVDVAPKTRGQSAITERGGAVDVGVTQPSRTGSGDRGSPEGNLGDRGQNLRAPNEGVGGTPSEASGGRLGAVSPAAGQDTQTAGAAQAPLDAAGANLATPVRAGVRPEVGRGPDAARMDFAPQTRSQLAITERARGLGIRVAWVGSPDGKPLVRNGLSYSPGVIALDANAPDAETAQALFWHEAVHDVQRRTPDRWDKLVADLNDLAPDVMRSARDAYAAKWGLASGKELPGSRALAETPAESASLVIDAILAGDAGGPTLSLRKLRAEQGPLRPTIEAAAPRTLAGWIEAKPTYTSRLILALDRLASRLGLSRAVGRFRLAQNLIERARAQSDLAGQRRQYGRAAALIREAVLALRNVDPNARPAGNQPGAQAGAQASPAAPTVRKAGLGEFGPMNVSDSLRDLLGRYGVSTDAEAVMAQAQRETGQTVAPPSFSFSGELPGEIKAALEGQPLRVKLKFRRNVPGATGADALSTYGAERLVAMARENALSGQAGLEELVGVAERQGLTRHDPDVAVLAALSRVEDRSAGLDVVENPSALPEGSTFTLGGQEYEIQRAEDGELEAIGDLGTIPLPSVLQRLPVDRGSLSMAEPTQVPSEPPFSVRGPLFSVQQPEMFDPAQPVAGRPVGRPDLANPGTTPGARSFINEVDEARNRLGQPEARADAEVERQVDAIIREKGIDGVRRDTLTKIRGGGLLNDVETRAAKEALSQTAVEALRRGDAQAYRDAAEFTHWYRVSGTEQARAFRQRRDTQASPRERVRDAMLQAMTLPPEVVRKRMEDLQRTIDGRGTQEERTAAQNKLDRLLDRESRRVGDIRERLTRGGLDPRVLTADTLADKRLAYRVAREVQNAKSTAFDRVFEYYLSSILSGVTTHTANIIGNTANAAKLLTVDRLVSAAVNLAVKDADSPQAGELGFMYRRIIPVLRDAVMNMGVSFRTEAPVFSDSIEEAMHARGQHILFSQDRLERGEFGAIPGTAGRVIRFPLRMLRAADEFFKTAVGTLDATGRAWRQAKAEGLEGDALVQRAEALLDDLSSLIWSEALATAETATFQEDTGTIGRAALTLRNIHVGNVRPLRFLVPFVSTPINIFKQGLSLSPQGQAFLLPRTVYRAASGGYLGNRGQLVRDLTNHLIAVGITSAVYFLSEPDDDGIPFLTGSLPEDRETADLWRRSGIQPMSIRVRGGWVSYRRIEPLATTLALAVDFSNAVRRGDPVEGLTGTLASLRQAAEDKTFLQGFGDLMTLATDPERAPSTGMKMAQDFVTAWVPNIVKQVVRADDPLIRDRSVWAEGDGRLMATLRKTPYAAFPAGDLAEPKRNIWGEPIEKQTPFGSTGAMAFMYRLGVPIDYYRDEPAAKADILLRNYHDRIERGELPEDAVAWAPAPPQPRITRNGQTIRLTPEEYDRLLEEGGRRTLESLNRRSLNVDKPTERDVKRIRDEFRRQYDRVRSEIWRDRQAAEAGGAP